MKRAKTKKEPVRMPHGGVCFNCRRAARYEDWCHGCKAHICDDCTEPMILNSVFYGMKHEPDDHLYRVIRVPRGWENKRGSGIRVITDDDEE